jgi:hypothetical protein
VVLQAKAIMAAQGNLLAVIKRAVAVAVQVLLVYLLLVIWEVAADRVLLQLFPVLLLPTLAVARVMV